MPLVRSPRLFEASFHAALNAIQRNLAPIGFTGTSGADGIAFRVMPNLKPRKSLLGVTTHGAIAAPKPSGRDLASLASDEHSPFDSSGRLRPPSHPQVSRLIAVHTRPLNDILNRFSGWSFARQAPFTQILYLSMNLSALQNETAAYNHIRGFGPSGTYDPGLVFLDKWVLRISLLKPKRILDMSNDLDREAFSRELGDDPDLYAALAAAGYKNAREGMMALDDASVSRGVVAAASAAGLDGFSHTTVRKSDRPSDETGSNLGLFGTTCAHGAAPVPDLAVNELTEFDKAPAGGIVVRIHSREEERIRVLK